MIYIFKFNYTVVNINEPKQKTVFKFDIYSRCTSSLLLVLYRTVINVTHTGKYLLFYARISMSIYIYIYSFSFFSFLWIYKGQMIQTRNDDDEPDIIGMYIFFMIFKIILSCELIHS